jgi:hypothetical protein
MKLATCEIEWLFASTLWKGHQAELIGLPQLDAIFRPERETIQTPELSRPFGIPRTNIETPGYQRALTEDPRTHNNKRSQSWIGMKKGNE